MKQFEVLKKKFNKTLPRAILFFAFAIVVAATFVVGEETISRIKSKNSKEMNIVQSADIYVSVSGDDETGDGSLASPFASVSKAIDSAVSGNKIYIMPGEYELDAMTTPHAGYAQAGICDQGKNLEIFGDNERTILYWDGAKSAKRDGPVFALSSYDTVVRNMTIIFSPKSGSNYQRAIFRWCNGRVENVFFRVTGSYAASYIYNNDGGSLRVKNCTFYHDLGKVDGNYSGKGEFINVLTNVNTIGTNTNVMVDDLGENTEETSTIIANSKLSLIYRNNEVGVFYGENSWFGYQMNVPTRYMNAGETMTISIDRICNGKRDMSASDWNWTSSNTSAATVSNGVVNGRTGGVTTITATSKYDSTDVIMCTLYVYQGTQNKFFDKLIYIDSENGDDDNGDGTRENPYQSIEKLADDEIIEQGYSYGVILAAGEYNLAKSTFELDCSESINIFGIGEETILYVDKLYSNSTGGSTEYEVNIHRVVWYGTSNTKNTIAIKTRMNLYSVAFHFDFDTCTDAYFDPRDNGVYMYNCVMPKTITNMLRTNHGGEVRLVNCYGGFTSGTGSSQDYWDYQTNYITDEPLVNQQYVISDSNENWKNVGTGEDYDGSQTDLGVYGGEYDWTVRYTFSESSRYESTNKNEYIKVGQVLPSSIYDVTDNHTTPTGDEYTWTSSNPDVASVDSVGNVTGLKVGYTTITGVNKQSGTKIRYIVTVYRNKTGAITTPQVVSSLGAIFVLKEDGTVWRKWYKY